MLPENGSVELKHVTGNKIYFNDILVNVSVVSSKIKSCCIIDGRESTSDNSM
jgi:hypothetical protein